MLVATREILERKSFDNKAIVLDEIRSVEEMINRKGLNKFVSRGSQAKKPYFFFTLKFFSS
jgi:hypothetical protein